MDTYPDDIVTDEALPVLFWSGDKTIITSYWQSNAYDLHGQVCHEECSDLATPLSDLLL